MKTAAGLLVLAPAVFLVGMTRPPAGHSFQAGEQLFDRSFSVSGNASLDVDVADADVRLQPGGSGSIEVSVYVDASDPDEGREVFQRMEFQAEESGGQVRVRAREPHMGSRWWGHGHRLQVVVVVRHPSATDIRVSTADGDIEAGDLTGEIELVSKDGDLLVGALRGGPIRLKTSDGDIQAGSVESSGLEVHTSDGDVDIGPVRSEATLSSGDGDIHVELAGSFPLSIRTGDGDVTLDTPEDLAATLDLEGEDISVDREIQLQGRVRNRSIRGDVGGGGPRIHVTTGDGEIRIRRH